MNIRIICITLKKKGSRKERLIKQREREVLFINMIRDETDIIGYLHLSVIECLKSFAKHYETKQKSPEMLF